MAGVQIRTSHASGWTECRQRGGSSTVHSLVMLDLASADALTATFATGTRGSAGTQSVAGSPLATVLAASSGLTHGRVGVVVDRAVADNQLGLYEMGEGGDGAVVPVMVRALVLVDAACVEGAALQVTTDGGLSVFVGGAAGAAYATLLEDCTADDGKGPSATVNVRWVVLYSAGIPTAVATVAQVPPNEINAQTGTTYELVLSDYGKIVTLSNAAAITLTVPANADVAFPVGTEIALIQTGVGVVTVDPGVGVTINSVSGMLNTAAQYTGATLLQTAADTWLLIGSLA